MNIKYGIAWFGLLGILLLGACIDDQGNYTYQEPDAILPIEISGLSDTTFKLLETVTLTPEVKGLENEENYWFTWYAYLKDGVGVPVRDTLGKTRNLTFKMVYPAGESRVLVYEIKDKRTGIFVNTKINIRGVSEFGKGWLVLHDENDQTDIDFVFPDGSVREDLLFENLHAKLQGTAVKVAYQKSRYYHQVTNPDGSVTLLGNLKALHVLSSRDMMTLNPDNLSLYKDFENEFYVAPEVANPQDFIISSFDLFLMNAGEIYTISGMSGNLGKFGLPKLNYSNLFPAMMNHVYSGNVLAFSCDSRSFVTTHPYWMNLDTLFIPKAENPLQVSSTHMNADMIAFVERNGDYSGLKAYALMKSVSGPQEYYLADITFGAQEYPFADFDTIPASRALVHADVYGGHQVNSLYFAKGNVLSYYQKNASDADSYEKTGLYPFPESETITWIKQVESPYNSKDPFNYLIVITNGNNVWKLYRFELEGDGVSPNLKAGKEPVVYSGKGFARYALWVE